MTFLTIIGEGTEVWAYGWVNPHWTLKSTSTEV